jgi:N-acetylmuramoyl-L-alanine amidase
LATAVLRSISAGILGLSLLAADAPPRSVRVGELAEDGARAAIEEGRTLVLLARAGPGDSMESLGSRYLAPGLSSSLLAAANSGRERMKPGLWYRVPITLLSPGWREKTLRAVFPADGPSVFVWVHRPGKSPLDVYGEGAWEVAVWFTGDGANFEAVLKANDLADPLLKPGAEITVPTKLLLPPFRRACEPAMRRGAPAVASGSSVPGQKAGGLDPKGSKTTPPTGGADIGSEERSPGLTFGKDDEGEYAAYRLAEGEALYSAVLVRFTGLVDPDDLAEAAATVAKRSGIRDVTNIPAGFVVKIPRPMILPEFLPPDDRRRKAFETGRLAAAKILNPVRSRNLQGIHVILDAGHGGVDPGAVVAGMSEHEYAYDVMCRVKRLLETTTAATVHPVIDDPATGFAPRQRKMLEADGGERILTTPPHVNGDPSETALGVNLRWYLANSIQRGLVRAGSDPARTVFVSFHADVLDPTLRGAMVYVPAERFRRAAFSCRDADCRHYEEVREAPVARYGKRERVHSEGLSRQFSSLLLAAFKRNGVGVHPYLPVRDHVVRRGREWLPAVLGGNSVPVKLLVEMVNLNNREDRTLIQDPSYRQAIAESFVQALLSYYAPPDTTPARATRPAGSKPRSG